MLIQIVTQANRSRLEHSLRQAVDHLLAQTAHPEGGPSAMRAGWGLGEPSVQRTLSAEPGGRTAQGPADGEDPGKARLLDPALVHILAMNDVGEPCALAVLAPPWAPNAAKLSSGLRKDLIAQPPSGPTVWEVTHCGVFDACARDEDTAFQVQSRMAAAVLEFALSRTITHFLGAACHQAQQMLNLLGLELEVLSAPFDTAYGPANFGFWRVAPEQLSHLRELCGLDGVISFEAPPATCNRSQDAVADMAVRVMDAVADIRNETALRYLLNLVVHRSSGMNAARARVRGSEQDQGPEV